MSTPALEKKRSVESEWKGAETGRISHVVLLIFARLAEIVSLWWFRAFFLCFFFFLMHEWIASVWIVFCDAAQLCLILRDQTLSAQILAPSVCFCSFMLNPRQGWVNPRGDAHFCFEFFWGGKTANSPKNLISNPSGSKRMIYCSDHKPGLHNSKAMLKKIQI